MLDIFKNIPRFGEKIVAVDSDSNESISYNDLYKAALAYARNLSDHKEIVFMEAENSIRWLIGYVGTIISGKVVYLVEDLNDDKMTSLINKYRPSLLIFRDLEVQRQHSDLLDISPELAVLLSTSGSTGTQKFVKLSYQNMASNAASIADYLKLTSEDIAFQYLRPHYSYGLSVIHSHLYCGGKLCFFNGKVGTPDSIRALEEHSCTSFSGVPYTYEFLHQSRVHLEEVPSLRYATQAGGKLAPDLVKEFATAFRAAGKQFFVMYGQTEASPRISYLPPEFAIEYPSSIGVSIPGGSLWVEDQDGNELHADGEKGELVYSGPNVMMGYATNILELANNVGGRSSVLHTGDIAYRQGELFYIIGRTSRFVKILGNRVGLDDLQVAIGPKFGQCAVVGTDEQITIFFERKIANQKSISPERVQSFVAASFKLPKLAIVARIVETFPLLPSGKVDFLTLKDMSRKPRKSFLDQFLQRINEALGTHQVSFLSVTEAVEDATGRKGGMGAIKIRELSLDSVAFVNLAVSLEELLEADLPNDWIDLTVDELEAIYVQSAPAV